MLTTSAYALVGTLFHAHFGMFMVRWGLGLGTVLDALPTGVLGVRWRAWLYSGTTDWWNSLPCKNASYKQL